MVQKHHQFILVWFLKRGLTAIIFYIEYTELICNNYRFTHLTYVLLLHYCEEN